MTDISLHIPLIKMTIFKPLLHNWATRRKAAHDKKELVLAARRLASLSPHLLNDIGLTDVR